MVRISGSTSCAAGMSGFVNGVNLLPSTGEFTYDTVPYLGQRTTETVLTSINRYANGGPLAGAGDVTDYSIALDNLQAEIPAVPRLRSSSPGSGNSTDVSACKIYPSTTYINGAFQQASGGADQWHSSGLTQVSPGLIPIPQNGDSFIYGGTPSDQSIVRCIQDLKARGLRVVFYPFILMTDAGESWRGEIAFQGTDVSSAATSAIDAFLGSATASQFTPDATNLTVGYSGSPTDFTYRRMILHYANSLRRRGRRRFYSCSARSFAALRRCAGRHGQRPARPAATAKSPGIIRSSPG